MKMNLQRILSLLCVLAMALTCAAALAEGPDAVQYDSRIITVVWDDGDNYDGIRPASVNASLGGQAVNPALSEANGWTGEVSVPADTDNAWTYDTVEGYTATLKEGSVPQISVLTYRHSVAPPIPVTARVEWDDSLNAAGIRPDSVLLALKADGKECGEPQPAKNPGYTVTWKDLPRFRPNSSDEIVYTVEQMQTPEGYVSSSSGLEVKNTIQMGRLALQASVTGAPEGADLSSLTLTVTGPDPSMPRTLTYGQISGGSVDLGSVLPGAYLVRGTNADTLVEGYIMDAANSRVSDAVMVKADETGTLTFKYTYKLPEDIDADEDYDPLANIGALSFEILGPDSRCPISLTYAQFNADGTYALPDLVPGVYTVVERNAETLVKYYTLTSASVTGMTIAVGPGGEATVKLFNQYVPAPTPEPDAEFVDIPVTKTWNDNNNKDGNRPDSITVRLYADGVEVDSHVLTAAEGWSFTFTEKPRYQDDNKTEIVYTVNEDAVSMYTATINGYNIVNNYHPEVTSISVSKIWRDNNDEKKQRPTSIAMTLSDGQKVVTVVILNEANGWAATVNDLPTVVNGQPARYAWKEQEVIGYTLEGVEERGNTMIFTNAIWNRPDNPPAGKKPKTTGETWYVFEEYDTPLGVEVVINHVGDCFD